MSYGNHTDCGLCRKHSANCWCVLWPAEVAGDRSDVCHQPDAHALFVQPGRILAMPRTLSDSEYERIARRWRAEHAGGRNAHRVTLLGRHPWTWWRRTYYRARRWLA
ncbi:hypothetical protein GCM10017774_78050 [Lentzea cavernae]|uniref:Uncharacterized protein n=1 Tax=Lentzea cavernae TaxID=2020703 RepID=A0ABQ3MR71_9PSEU|nr:hypothetical protein GCM10017774_78050 [Lentzea cavernae]